MLSLVKSQKDLKHWEQLKSMEAEAELHLNKLESQIVDKYGKRNEVILYKKDNYNFKNKFKKIL